METAKPRGVAGFTLVEIMIVVAIIGLLAAIAMPNAVRARAKSQATGCINNMHQIDGAVTEWALEQGKKTGDPAPGLTSDLTPYIKLNANGFIPQCPAQGTYTLNAVGTVPQIGCSLSTLDPPHTYCRSKARLGSEGRRITASLFV